jgi:hypothetical protein
MCKWKIGEKNHTISGPFDLVYLYFQKFAWILVVYFIDQFNYSIKKFPHRNDKTEFF